VVSSLFYVTQDFVEGIVESEAFSSILIGVSDRSVCYQNCSIQESPGEYSDVLEDRKINLLGLAEVLCLVLVYLIFVKVCV
jgi:hypothetical protein